MVWPRFSLLPSLGTHLNNCWLESPALSVDESIVVRRNVTFFKRSELGRELNIICAPLRSAGSTSFHGAICWWVNCKCIGGVLEDTIWSLWPQSSSPWLWSSRPWPRSLQVLGNALSSARGQHCFLTCGKWAKAMTNFVSSWRMPESLRKKFWRHFFFWRTLEISGKFTKFWSEDLFFWDHFCVVSLVLGLGLEKVCPR